MEPTLLIEAGIALQDATVFAVQTAGEIDLFSRVTTYSGP